MLCLVGAGCGEIEEPDGFGVVTQTTTSADGGDPDLGALEQSSGTPVVSSTTTEFVPRREPGYLPEVLISASGDVLAWAPGSLRELDGPLADLTTERAVDDLVGGLVVQLPATTGEPGTGEIVWYPAEGDGPAVINDGGARLLDVGYVDGSPSAVLLAGPDRIDRVRLVDNARTPMVMFDDGEEVLDLSASGSFHAVVLANDRCGDLRFYQADGTRVFFSDLDEPDCIVPQRPAYGVVALSPAAGAVVYTEVTYRDDGIEVATELVARDLTTNTEFFRRRIGEDGDRITAIAFDGDRVVYLREPGVDQADADVDLGPAVVVLVISDEVETPIELTGVSTVESVSFTRLELAGASS